MHQGRLRDAYEAYARFVWPEYFRQSPQDALRSWYLAYFAPVAFSVCEYDEAYAISVTQLADAAAAGSGQGQLERLSASALAGVLSVWGDEASAAEVERQFGVRRMREGDTSW